MEDPPAARPEHGSGGRLPSGSGGVRARGLRDRAGCARTARGGLPGAGEVAGAVVSHSRRSAGCLDRPAAVLELARGRLDAAEQFATASLRRWEGISEVGRIKTDVVLATIHVRAGEPGALALAHRAIRDVTKLSSVRARKQLDPLAIALEARPGSDAKELARITRQVAATRP